MVLFFCFSVLIALNTSVFRNLDGIANTESNIIVVMILRSV